MSKKAEGRRVLETETRSLPVKLTESEMATRGRAMGMARERFARVEEEFTGIKADYKGRLETLDAQIAQFGRVLASGQETREVKCERIVNWETERLELVRTDTQEVVEARVLTDKERQQELFRRGKKNGQVAHAEASAAT